MTTEANRALRDEDSLDDVAFDERGLAPVIAQDDRTGRVLMLGWANRDALAKTLSTGLLTFWSRSRSELWQKGETSGNTMELVSLQLDCDRDAILARVHPNGPACHTGDSTCFGSGNPLPAVLDRLDRTLAARNESRPEGSYTTRLLEDANLRLKKLGEEGAELVSALATSDADRATEEVADLLYHALVALRAEGKGWSDVARVLEYREANG